MDILLVEDDESVRDIISYTIQAKFKTQITYASSCEEAIQLLGINKYDLIISDYFMEGKTGGDLYLYLLENKKIIPFVICSSIDPDEFPAFNDRSYFIGNIVKPFIFDGVNEIIKSYEIFCSTQDNLNLSDVKRESASYSKININLLSKIDKAECKILAKVNDEKIIPVFEVGDDLSEEKLTKLRNKGFEYLYIERVDSKIFFDLISSQIIDILHDENTEVEARIVKAHEKISDVAINLGFSDHLIMATEESVKLTLEVMKSNKELKKIYKRMFTKSDNYLSSHSIALCYISCGILNKTEWNKFEAKNKLVFASYFHDVAINDASFREDKKISTLNPQEKEIFASHIDQSVEFVRNFKEIPMDVDKIILYHHETPNYDGINKGVAQSSIPPLACVFIFSHLIVDILFELEQEDIDPSYAEVDKRIDFNLYTSKNFEKVIKAYRESELFA